MQKILPAICFLLLIAAACDRPTPVPKSKEREAILDRNGQPFYRAEIPAHWKREVFQTMDTTQPNVRFEIEPGLHLAVHQFPYNSFEERIPPEAQTARWQRQLGDPAEISLKHVSHGGFAGLEFEAYQEDRGILAWAMQLAPAYFFALESPLARSDYTIKAAGAKQALLRHRPAIIAFAQSFECIDELPSPL